jgi:hypothetical protein
MGLRFVSNDVRRHRLISISYISLLPCHGSVLALPVDPISRNPVVLLGFRAVRCSSGVPYLDFIRAASAPVAPFRPRPFEFLPDCTPPAEIRRGPHSILRRRGSRT